MIYALKNPSGFIYSWSTSHSSDGVKKKTRRWGKSWEDASKEGFSVVCVKLIEVKP